jgi:hypothetical protein
MLTEPPAVEPTARIWKGEIEEVPRFRLRFQRNPISLREPTLEVGHSPGILTRITKRVMFP